MRGGKGENRSSHYRSRSPPNRNSTPNHKNSDPSQSNSRSSTPTAELTHAFRSRSQGTRELSHACDAMRHVLRGQRKARSDVSLDRWTPRRAWNVLRHGQGRARGEHEGAWRDLGKATRASGAVKRVTRSPTPCLCKEGCMNAVLRRRLEMAARVRDFLRAHKQSRVEIRVPKVGRP